MGRLDLQRALVHYKCTGLSDADADADAHRALPPTSPLMTMAGLVSHLRWVERCWLEVLFLGRPAGANPQFGDVEDAAFLVDDVPLAQLLSDYERQCAVSNEITAAASLDDTGGHPDFGAAGGTLRRMLIHLVEEVARHVGQMDVLREQLDGSTGHC